MKLLHLGKYYPPFHGGMESYLRDLAEAQVKQGHEVWVLVHNHQWGWLTSSTVEETINGVQVIRVACSRPVLHTPLMPGLNRRIRALVRQHDFDLLHLHTPNPSLLPLSWNRQAKAIPRVISWHSDMVTEHSGLLMRSLYRLLKPFETRLLKQADCVLVSSRNYAEHSPQLHRHSHKVKVIPLGIDANARYLAAATDADPTPDWPEGTFRLFHLGRLTRYKNQQLLIAAMQHMEQAHLVLAGSGALQDRLQQQVERLNGSDKVTLTGAISAHEAHQLFSSCDVFCLASHDRAESFGVVLLEAMYHNKIILVADTPGSGMRWLAERYNKGFVFRSNDVNDLLAQLQHIRSDLASIKALPGHFDYDISDIAQQIEDNYPIQTQNGGHS